MPYNFNNFGILRKKIKNIKTDQTNFYFLIHFCQKTVSDDTKRVAIIFNLNKTLFGKTELYCGGVTGAFYA